VRDRSGKDLSGLTAEYWHATRLIYRLSEYPAETGEDWVLEVADESDAVPLVLLPHLVLMLRRRGQAVRAWRPPLSNLGEGPGGLTSALSSASPSLSSQLFGGVVRAGELQHPKVLSPSNRR